MKKVVFIFLVLIFSCDINEFDFNNVQLGKYEGEWRIKTLYSPKYTFIELLDLATDSSDANIQVDSDFRVKLIYEDSMTIKSLNNLFPTEDTLRVNLITLGPDINSQTHELEYVYGFNPSDEIDSVFFESGELQVTLSIQDTASFNYNITFPNIFENDGSPVSISNTGMLTPNIPNTHQVNISNHHIKFEKYVNSQNLYPVKLEIIPTQPLRGTESVTMGIKFENQVFKIMYGKFGTNTIDFPQRSINIELFEGNESDGIIFRDPLLSFDYVNSYGIPFGIDYGMENHRIFFITANNTYPLEGNITDELDVVERIFDLNLLNSSNKHTDIDKNNSNIQDIISNSPPIVQFNMKAVTNPHGIDANTHNFIRPTDSLSSKIYLEIPMNVRLDNYIRTSSIDISNEIQDLSSVDTASMRIVVRNQLPLSGKILRVEIKDADSVVLHTIPTQMVLKNPIIANDGTVSEPSFNVADFPMGSNAIEAYTNGAIMEFSIELNTPITQSSREIYVEVLSYYTLEIEIGLHIKLNLDL